MGPQSTADPSLETQPFAPTMGMTEAEFQALVDSTLIMIPHRSYEGINAGLAQALGAWARFGGTVATVVDNFGGFIEITRAGMVRTFLEYCANHPLIDNLVMIDADQNVPWDAPYRLAAWEQPVVSGVVCSFNETRGVFACFTAKDEFGVPRFPSFNFTKTLPGRGLLKVHECGTGLICIKKHVLETMLSKNIAPFYIPEEVRRAAANTGLLAWGEDIAFCRQCDELGFDRHVDFFVRAAHFKTMPITWPRAALDFDTDPQEWRVSSKDYRHG